MISPFLLSFHLSLMSILLYRFWPKVLFPLDYSFSSFSNFSLHHLICRRVGFHVYWRSSSKLAMALLLWIVFPFSNPVPCECCFIWYRRQPDNWILVLLILACALYSSRSMYCFVIINYAIASSVSKISTLGFSTTWACMYSSTLFLHVWRNYCCTLSVLLTTAFLRLIYYLFLNFCLSFFSLVL